MYCRNQYTTEYPVCLNNIQVCFNSATKPPGRHMTKSQYEKTGRRYYEKNKELCIKRNAISRGKRRVEWHDFKSRLACSVCGFSHPAVIDFHHRDPSTKKGSVFRLAADGKWRRAYEEAMKCDVLCANCHRIHHYNERKKHKEAKFQLNLALESTE